MSEHNRFEHALPPLEQQEAKEAFIETLHGLTFEPEYNTESGKLQQYVSRNPSKRKIVILKPDQQSIEPSQGVPYEVGIVFDTKPGDPLKGKMFGKIISRSTKIDVEEWKRHEESVELVEEPVRRLAGIKHEAYRHTKIPNRYREMTERLVQEGVLDLVEKDEIIELLQSEEKDVQAQIDILLGPKGSPQRALMSHRAKAVTKAVKDYYSQKVLLDELEKKKLRLEQDIRQQIRNGQSVTLKRTLLQRVSEDIKQVSDVTAAMENPEFYYVSHLMELRGYKKDLQQGKIVETDYVKKNAEEIAAQARLGNPVLIYGHLGSGKTELAMHVARKYILNDRPDLDEKVKNEFELWLSKNVGVSAAEQRHKKNELETAYKSAIILSGSKNTSLAEIYGHKVLALDKVGKDEYDQFTEEVYKKYQAWLAEHENALNELSIDAREGEKNRAHERILQTYLTKFKNGTITEYFLGPIYRAMEQGRPLIIDEVNAIPHEILISLNYFLTRKPGDVVLVQQDSGKTIVVREGFSVMMTGNLNHGQKKYIERQDLDPALLSRLHKVEHDYLPQALDGVFADAKTSDNEIFKMILSYCMDRRGNVEVPAGSLKQLWELACAARFTQDSFSGKTLGEKYNMKADGVSGGVPHSLQEGVLSLRNLTAVLQEWVNSGYEKELDYYVYTKFIKNITNPSDRAYLYQQLQLYYGFFASPGWENLPSFPNIKTLKSFSVAVPQNPSNKVVYYTPRQVVDKLYGEGPKRDPADYPAYS